MADKLMPWELADKWAIAATAAAAHIRKHADHPDAAVSSQIVALQVGLAGELSESLNNLADALEDEAKLERVKVVVPGYPVDNRALGRADALRDVAKRLRGGK